MAPALAANRDLVASISQEDFDPRLRWLIIAASSVGAAERFSKLHGLSSPLILDRFDLVRIRGRIDRLVRRHAVDRVCIHSLDWSREKATQLYIASLAVSRITDALLVDERSQRVTQLSRRAVAASTARIPFELVTGMGAIGREILRSHSHSTNCTAPAGLQGARPDAVVALWLEASLSVGGPVTHISGILQGFRAIGLK